MTAPLDDLSPNRDDVRRPPYKMDLSDISRPGARPKKKEERKGSSDQEIARRSRFLEAKSSCGGKPGKLIDADRPDMRRIVIEVHRDVLGARAYRTLHVDGLRMWRLDVDTTPGFEQPRRFPDDVTRIPEMLVDVHAGDRIVRCVIPVSRFGIDIHTGL